MSRNPIDIYNEAYCYYTANDGYPLNCRKAIELFHEAAELGVSHAMNYLGIVYEAGEHVPQDLQAAAGWYYKAYQADDRNLHAKYNLGRIFFHGIGVGKDWEKAELLFTKVVDAGAENNTFIYGNSCNFLGSILYHRNDHPSAYPYFVKAAKYGNIAEAWYTLGWYLDQGFQPSNYTDPDGEIATSAFDCYSRSARLGYAPGMHILGVKLLKANQTEAGTELITEAAIQGYEPAKKALRIINAGKDGLSGISKGLLNNLLKNFQ